MGREGKGRNRQVLLTRLLGVLGRTWRVQRSRGKAADSLLNAFNVVLIATLIGIISYRN